MTVAQSAGVSMRRMLRRPRILCGLALVSGAGALVVWFVGLHTAAGRRLDAQALLSFTGVAPTDLTASIGGVAGLADPAPMLCGAVALVIVALLRRRWLMAAAVPAILLAANATTQVLKPALAESRVVDFGLLHQTFTASWPSGHSTAAMSLALCGVLVAGPRLRPLAALLGAAYAVAVGYSLVALGHHLPSDVFGGYLVAATFTLLGAAALEAAQSREPRRAPWVRPPPQALSAPALALGATTLVAVMGVAILIDRPAPALAALGHTAAVLAAVAIGALGLLLTSGFARVLDR